MSNNTEALRLLARQELLDRIADARAGLLAVWRRTKGNDDAGIVYEGASVLRESAKALSGVAVSLPAPEEQKCACGHLREDHRPGDTAGYVRAGCQRAVGREYSEAQCDCMWDGASLPVDEPREQPDGWTSVHWRELMRDGEDIYIGPKPEWETDVPVYIGRPVSPAQPETALSCEDWTRVRALAEVLTVAPERAMDVARELCEIADPHLTGEVQHG